MTAVILRYIYVRYYLETSKFVRLTYSDIVSLVRRQGYSFAATGETIEKYSEYNQCVQDFVYAFPGYTCLIKFGNLLWIVRATVLRVVLNSFKCMYR